MRDLIAIEYEVDNQNFLQGFNKQIDNFWILTRVGHYVYIYIYNNDYLSFEFGDDVLVDNSQGEPCYNFNLIQKFDNIEQLRNKFISHIRTIKIDNVINRINK